MSLRNHRRSGTGLALAALVCAGAWLAWPHAARAGDQWSIARPDTLGDRGEYSSLALHRGRPRIAYFDFDHLDLRYAERDLGRWKITVVDSTEDLFFDVSLAVDANGRPHIAYYNATKQWLRYATRTGLLWTIEDVDVTVDAGSYLALALDQDGAPGIAYFDATGNTLRYAHREGSSWIRELVDNNGTVGTHASLAYDSSNRPHVSYRSFATGDLKYAFKNGSTWMIQTVEAPNNVGYYSSIAVASSGQVHIGYYDATLQRLRHAAGSFGSWSLETVDNAGAGRTLSLTLDANERPRFAYRREPSPANGDLAYAFQGPTGWTTMDVDTTGDVGYFPSIAMGLGDRPRIAYYDNSRFDLCYAELLPTGLVLNEFAVRPPTGRAEFFEVYNGTPDTVDLGAYQITATRWDSLSAFHDFIYPADRLKAPGTFDAESTLGMANFFYDAGAVVSLLDSAGSALDRVGYGVGGGAPISCPLYVPTGAPRPPGFRPGKLGLDAAMAVTATSETLMTSTNRIGADTGDDAEDWGLGTPTFAAANQAPAPDLGSSVRLNGAYVFPHNGDGDPVNESIQLMNPLGGVVEAGGDYVSDGFLVRPLFAPEANLPLEPGQKYLVVQGLNGDLSFELEEDDRLDLYETREEGLVRVDQLGWAQLPSYFPDSAAVRVPDGSGPSGGWDWNTSGGDVNLFYTAHAPFLPGTTDARPGARISALASPAPNPARGAVAFGFEIAGAAGSTHAVEVALYDARGRRVARPIATRLEAGPHRVLWSPGASGTLRSGVYWMRLTVAGLPAGEPRRLVWLGP